LLEVLTLEELLHELHARGRAGIHTINGITRPASDI
jgi:hypothetical protein